MDTLLLLLGALGALLIGAHLIAQRNRGDGPFGSRHPRMEIERRSRERRSGEVVAFPLQLKGETIVEDRRVQPDRRNGADRRTAAA